MGFQSIEELIVALVDAYYEKRDVEATLALVTDDIKWIGTENNDSANGKAELKELLKADVNAFPGSFQIALEEPIVQVLSENIVTVWATGRQVDIPGVICGFTIRGTLTCLKGESGWLIANIHVSVPNSEMEKYTLEKELDDKRRREQVVMAAMPGGVAIYRLKKDGRVTTDYVSESLAKMCGYTASEFLSLLSENAVLNIVEEDIPAVMQAVEQNLAKAKLISVRYRIYNKEHKPVLVRLDANVITTEPLGEDDRAVLYAVHTFVSDESKRIIEEQGSLRELINKVPTGIGIYEIKDGAISQNYMNDAFYAMLGDKRENREAFTGLNALTAVNPEDKPLLEKAMYDIISGDDMVEVTYRLKVGTGKWFWLHLTASVIERRKDYIKLFTAFANFNANIMAKQELEAGRITMETALDSVKALTWRFDYRSSTITDSLTLGVKYGLPKVVENVPQSIIDSGFISNESIESFRDMFKRMPEEKTVFVDTKSNVIGEKGLIWYRQIYTPVFDSTGNYVDSIAVALDITEQKEREHRYEEQLRLNKISAKDALATASYNLTMNTVSESDSSEMYFRRIMSGGTADIVLKAIHDGMTDCEDSGLCKKISSANSLINLFKSGTSHLELRHRMEGDKRWLQTTFDMVTNPYTGDAEAIGILRDITEIVRAEQVVNQLLKVDYRSILIVDAKTGEASPFRRQKEDRNLVEIEAIQKEKSNGQLGLAEFLRKNCVPGTAEKAIQENSLEFILNKLESAPYYECMYTLLQNGEKSQFRVIYSYLGHDRSVLLSAVQDTTAMYEQEEKQKQELSTALEEAEKANRTKIDFLSRMSHDMRTPMNAIIGLSALTLDDADKPDIVRENMGKMRQAGDFMLGLVNDILDMARIEDGSVVLHMEPYTYSDFLMNMKTMFVPQCEAKGIDISFVEPVHIDPTGLTDKIRINQIFFNIFSNAVKYTPTGGRIDCDVRNIRTENNRIFGEYVIRDSGVGMSEEFQKHLFEPFTQEDGAVTPELQGSGLGLSITKQLVELMGGFIKIESKKGEGTAVIIGLSFELVAKPEADKSVNIEAVSKLSLAGKKVLLCEDHPLNAQIARRLLEKEGMVVAYAANGRIATEKFSASDIGTFDFILMDIRMPEMSGLEASKYIRAMNRPDAETVPIIAMSANAYPEDVERGMECGMTDYLTKPVEPAKLYEVLRTHLI